MKHCKYYKGTQTVDGNHTQINCTCAEGGARVYANSDPAGRIVNKCWNDGEGCPYKAEHEAATSIISDERAAEIEAELDREELENEQLAFAEIAPTLISQSSEKLETAPISLVRQEKAMKLHEQIIANGTKAVEAIMAMGRDLKTINDEMLFVELGYSNFKEYCNAYKGISYSYGYLCIRVYKRFGQQPLTRFEGYGIGKLAKLASLEDEEVDELLSDENNVNLSDSQFQEKISELQSRCEQLTLDLECERDKNRTLSENSEAAELETQVEELKAKLEEYEKNEDIYVNRLVDYEKKDKETAEKASALEKELAELREKNAELESRPIDVAVQPPSEEELEKIREAARAEERKLYKEELKKVREQADSARLTAVEAARKQEADKLAAEIDKLKAENAVLQSNARPSTPPDSDKERIKFFVGECQRSFNAAWEIICSVPDEVAKNDYIIGMKAVIKQMEGVVNA